jgi:hypothetical protein
MNERERERTQWRASSERRREKGRKRETLSTMYVPRQCPFVFLLKVS